MTITITIEKTDSELIAIENTIRNNINDQNVINKDVLESLRSAYTLRLSLFSLQFHT